MRTHTLLQSHSYFKSYILDASRRSSVMQLSSLPISGYSCIISASTATPAWLWKSQAASLIVTCYARASIKAKKKKKLSCRTSVVLKDICLSVIANEKQGIPHSSTIYNTTYRNTDTHIHTHIYISTVKLATVVEGDSKAPFSIATTPRCREGRYSFPKIAPFYPLYVPYNV